jgi:hypothetical protein
MRKYIKRIVSICLAAALTVGTLMLFSCSNKEKLNRTAVGTVGDHEVYYEELRWMTMQYKDLMAANYGEDIWKNKETAEKYRKELENAVFSNIIANYAVLTLCDDDMLKLNGEKLIDINGSEVQGIVQDYVDATIEEAGGRAEYNKSLEENYLTDNLYRFMCGVDTCESILFSYYCNLAIIDDSDEAAIDYIYENFIRTVHVYIQNDKGDDVEANRALAEAVRIKLVNGEDINTIVKNYSEDRYMASSDGYYFTNGQYSDAYENAAFALGIGEISPVVETYSGFYVIQRLELDGAYIGAHFSTDLKDQYLLAVFNKEIEKCKESLSFTLNDFGLGLDLVEME